MVTRSFVHLAWRPREKAQLAASFSSFHSKYSSLTCSQPPQIITRGRITCDCGPFLKNQNHRTHLFLIWLVDTSSVLPVLKNLIKMQGVLRHLKLSRPFGRPFIFPKFEHTNPADMENNGFEGTTIFGILKAKKSKSGDGSRIWCPTEDLVNDALTLHNAGALVVMKPGEQKSVAGITMDKVLSSYTSTHVCMLLRQTAPAINSSVCKCIIPGRRSVPHDVARKYGMASLSTRQFRRYKSSSTSDNAGASPGGDGHGLVGEGDPISLAEAKKLMRLVNVESLKMKLGLEGKEVIGYSQLLKACESMGVARSLDEAAAFAKVLDEAGVVLLFRDKVYLHPDKVVDLVRSSVPFALTAEDDPRKEELKSLQDRKREIDRLAQRQVRRILWSGLGFSVAQVGIFFRLTFWEFSWDVMEPIAFFSTAIGIVIGYAYFLVTRRDPTYQDLMERLFLSRQRKLFKKHNFDVSRFKELQNIDTLATYKKAQKKLVLEDA